MKFDSTQIVYIDDDEDDYILFKNALAAYWPGSQSVYLPEPTALFAYLDAQANRLPDLILVDNQMPIMSGYEVAAELLKNPRYAFIPVVVYSGSLDTSDAASLSRRGVDYVMVKPVRQEEMQAVVERLQQRLATS